MRAPPHLAEAIGALLKDVAARTVMPHFRALTTSDVREKTGPDDLVTIADRMAELAITEDLERLYPAARVIGEEAAAADPGLLNGLSGPEPYFVVDPVDGTWNFAHGIERFALMVGLCTGGEPVLGAIYLPCTDELVIAERGGGAWRNGARLATPPAVSFAAAAGDFSKKYVAEPLATRFAAALARAGSTQQRNCSGVAYVDTATGRNDFMLQYLLMPWDHVAGTLIVAEAGGATRYLSDAVDYQPGRLAPEPLLTAGDRDQWAAYAAALGAA